MAIFYKGYPLSISNILTLNNANTEGYRLPYYFLLILKVPFGCIEYAAVALPSFTSKRTA